MIVWTAGTGLTFIKATPKGDRIIHGTRYTRPRLGRPRVCTYPKGKTPC